MFDTFGMMDDLGYLQEIVCIIMVSYNVYVEYHNACKLVLELQYISSILVQHQTFKRACNVRSSKISNLRSFLMKWSNKNKDLDNRK